MSERGTTLRQEMEQMLRRIEESSKTLVARVEKALRESNRTGKR
jgi:hypothetical protein